MNYALIVNGTAANVIYLHPMNAGDFPGAVPIFDLPVMIGDEYHDGAFWRDGVEVTAKPPETQGSEEQEDMQEALAILGVEVQG